MPNRLRRWHVRAVHLHCHKQAQAGALEAEKRRVPQLCEFIEANEPRVLAFNEYVDDDGSEVAVVQVHPDAESMEFHMSAVREHAERAYAETLDSTISIQV